MKILIAVGSTLLGAFLFQMPSTPPMKMGLWETTSTTKMTGLDLPPGMNIPGLASRTVNVKSCMTPESYQKNMLAAQRTKDCVISNEKWTAGGYSFDMACSKGRTTGRFEMKFEGMEASHGTMHMTIDSGNGKPIMADSTMEAHFVSSDCGAIKPDSPVIGH